jgi:2-dehydro-3-deoxy-D-arabinonate dehydratase
MRICRFKTAALPERIGLVVDQSAIIDLGTVGLSDLEQVLEHPDPVAFLRGLKTQDVAPIPLAQAKLLAPVERQEVWAAGVTYLRSRAARMEESDFSATAYDRVYAADRPELFFKSMPQKVVGSEASVGIRRDAKWNVPEPELALVLNSRGQLVGFTIGNDMSSRDIEGENLLYLPQAKIYDGSCALGPWIQLGASEKEAREWEVQIAIRRQGELVFSGGTSVSKIKRSFEELASYLFRSQTFPHGAILLTGTGVIPPDSFTLQSGDEIDIEISGIGRLKNSVAVV